MKLIDIAVLAAVAVIVIAILVYVRKAKKKSIGCIGCPNSGKCSGNCDCTRK